MWCTSGYNMKITERDRGALCRIAGSKKGLFGLEKRLHF
jgi:hypothetical protein